MPLQQTLGPSATSFFCAAVEGGSRIYLEFLRTPWSALAVLAGIAAAGIWLSRRTRWSPVLSVPLDQVRSGGQIYRTAWLLYRRNWRLLFGIGLVFLPLSVAAAIVQQLVFSFAGIGTLVSVARSDPLGQRRGRAAVRRGLDDRRDRPRHRRGGGRPRPDR